MTDRALTAGMEAAVQASALRPVLFYAAEFATGTLRLWTGVGTVTWDSQTWTGAGNLLAISPLEEKRTVEALGFTVTLSGMPSSLVSIALASLRQGKPGKIWLGALDAAGAVIADPYLSAQGKLDIGVIDDDGANCTIAVQYESRLIDLQRPRVRRYTAADQALDYPADLGFSFVPSLQDKQLIWGGPAAAAAPLAATVDDASSDTPRRQHVRQDD